jgi:hypothetical protein
VTAGPVHVAKSLKKSQGPSHIFCHGQEKSHDHFRGRQVNCRQDFELAHAKYVVTGFVKGLSHKNEIGLELKGWIENYYVEEDGCSNFLYIFLLQETLHPVFWADGKDCPIYINIW